MLTPLPPRKERPGLEREEPLKVISEGSWSHAARFIGYCGGKERWALVRTVIVEFERSDDELQMLSDLLSDCVELFDGIPGDRTNDYGDGACLALEIGDEGCILREDGGDWGDWKVQ